MKFESYAIANEIWTDFLTKPSASEAPKPTSARQAFFSRFSRRAREVLLADGVTSADVSPSPGHRRPARPLITLTGGLRTPSQLAQAIQHGHADLLGLGRPAVLMPNFPKFLRRLAFENKHDAAESSSISSSDPSSTLSCNLSSPLQTPEVLNCLLRDPSPDTPSWFPRLVGASVNMAWYVLAMRRLASHDSRPRKHQSPQSKCITFEPDGLDTISFHDIGCGLGLAFRPAAVIAEMYLGVPLEKVLLMSMCMALVALLLRIILSYVI